MPWFLLAYRVVLAVQTLRVLGESRGRASLDRSAAT
jgi:hypothetical protein